MKWKKLARALLFPPLLVVWLVLPAGMLLLVCCLLLLPETAPLRIASYALAFYALLICCLRLPDFLRCLRGIKNGNSYVQRWLNDPALRMNITVTGSVIWNGAYAALQLGLGVYHRSAWFYALATYYASLAVIRFFLVRHTLRHRPGEKLRVELKYYRASGWILLFMNMALSVMMVHMIQEGRVTVHHEITTIAMAAYTFTALTMAIINLVKYRRYQSPAMSAAKAISLAAACVSMLTLENTMLTTFRSENMTPQTQRIFLGLSGGGISLLIIVMAVYMIVRSGKKMKELENRI